MTSAKRLLTSSPTRKTKWPTSAKTSRARRSTGWASQELTSDCSARWTTRRRATSSILNTPCGKHSSLTRRPRRWQTRLRPLCKRRRHPSASDTRAGVPVDEAGTLPRVLVTSKASYLTTTIIVKYDYQEFAAGDYRLAAIAVAALPNGMLQYVYNPSATDTIWRAGRNAPTRGEPFRVRLVFGLLKAKMNWRVQTIPMAAVPLTWED